MFLKMEISNIIIKYKLIGIILYFIISLAGLSILFIFSVSNILFSDNSKENKYKIYLFKNFVKDIYTNLNKSFIQNITLTEENKTCPEGFEELLIENQYYGHFSKFYGNKSFCIQRFNDSYDIYEQSLYIKNKCEKGKRYCGIINKYLNTSLCLDINIECPINYFDFHNKGDHIYPITNDKYFSVSLRPDKSVIVDIEIINNDKLCLERHISNNYLSCEFPDNNECFILDEYEEIYNQQIPDKYKLSSENLAKWNLINDDNIVHNFCSNNLLFKIFKTGYVSFAYDNLQDFKREFSSINENNNPLYKMTELYTSFKNINRLIHLISIIILCWPLISFIFQIISYYGIKKIEYLYIYNGIILFFFKVLLLFCMLIYHYICLLKIEKVYLILIDKNRNKILEMYKSIRKSFITKIIILWIVGFIIISVDLVILLFNIIFYFYFKKTKYKEGLNPIVKGLDNSKNEEKIEEKNSKSFMLNNFENTPNSERIIVKYGGSFSLKSPISIEENPNLPNKFDNIITLQFVFKDKLTKIYSIKVNKNEIIVDVIERLKEKYPELKEKKIKVLAYDSNIINKNKTIIDNGILNSVKIIIVS